MLGDMPSRMQSSFVLTMLQHEYSVWVKVVQLYQWHYGSSAQETTNKPSGKRLMQSNNQSEIMDDGHEQ